MTEIVRRKKEKPILPELAQKMGKANRKRNLVLIIMIAVSTASLFSLLTLARGRMLADQLKATRENGIAADAVLNAATREQFRQISQLNYIDSIGIEKSFGICYLDQRRLCDCSIMTEEDYFKMYAPAYDDLTGNYPDQANEVMLSAGILNSMGITEPQIGMEIPLKIVRNDWMINHAEDIQESFFLSGYYTDYSRQMDELPTAYFSTEILSAEFLSMKSLTTESFFEEFIEEKSMELFPADILMKSDYAIMADGWLEKQLYQDVNVENGQRFYVWKAGLSQSILKMSGGYLVAVFGICLMLFGLYLFIYNVLSISNRKDRKQYGLLKVVGISPKQLKKLFLIQSFRMVITGVVTGAAAGNLLVIFVLPDLIGRMYLAGFGSMTDVNLFSDKLLYISMAFTGIGAWAAFYKSVHSLMNLAPITCLHGNDTISVQNGFQTWFKRNALLEMAWRNVNRDKRKMIVTLSSLFLGIMVALLSVCITNGLDQTNRIAQNPDFTIGITKDAVESCFYQNAGRELDEVQGHDLLTEELISDILNAAGVQRENVVECIGAYGITDVDSIAMLPGTEQEIRERVTELTIQAVPDKWLKQLADYVEKEELVMDLDTFTEGNGFLFLHENAFTEEQAQEAEKYIGEKFPFFVIEDGGKSYELTCCGYLDIAEEDFPVFPMPWNGSNLNYLIVSEKTFGEMKCKPQIYQISFDVEERKEPEIKQAIQRFLVNANQNAEISNSYEMTANSELLAAEESYIFATRLVMGVFSGILIFLAVINYANTVVTGMVSREQEFSTMQNIGMTKRQLTKMLILEGNCYCVCTLSLVISIGSVILFIAREIMKERVSYFVFEYPVVLLLVMMSIFLVSNVVLPGIVLCRKQDSNYY